MTIVAAPLGILASLVMAASPGIARFDHRPPPCHGGRDLPDQRPDAPLACHALGCTAPRRVRDIP